MTNLTSQRYTVRKINLFPLAKFGCLLGSLSMLLPGVICALVGVQIVAVLRGLMEQWQAAEVDPLGMGVPVEFDFVNLLGLEIVQTTIIRLDDQRFILTLLIILIAMIGGGLLVGLIILLTGWGYNLLAALTGGLEVELRDKGRQ
jgi:hypothetical protein